MKRSAVAATALAFAALLSAGCSKTDTPTAASTTTAAASGGGGGGGGGATKLDVAKCGEFAGAWGALTASIATTGADDATTKKIAEIKAAVPADVAKNIEIVENGIKGKSTVDAGMFIAQGEGQKAFTAVTTWLSTSCAAAAGK